jgi:sarcosine oxidase
VTERYDTVVVGAGAMGASTAWWLARRGRSVLLVEQFEAGHTRGSSHGGSRIFRYAYPDPVYVRLVVEARPLWTELEDDAGETLLDLVGAVDHGDPATVRALAEAMRAAGVPCEELSPAAAEERWPNLRFEGTVVHQPLGGRSRADATVAALTRRAADHGAVVRFGTGPAAVEVVGDGVAVTAGGERVEAATAVVTAGAWMARTAGGLVDLPPLTVTEEQLVHFPPVSAPGAPTDWPSFIHHTERFWYGLVTPGVGIKLGGHHEGAVIEPDQRRAHLEPAYVEGLVRYAEHWLPGVVPEPRAEQTCLYTNTPDSRFLLDRAGPIVVGSPCSGHGFKFVPLIGRLLADLTDGIEPSGPYRRLGDPITAGDRRYPARS